MTGCFQCSCHPETPRYHFIFLHLYLSFNFFELLALHYTTKGMLLYVGKPRHVSQSCKHCKLQINLYILMSHARKEMQFNTIKMYRGILFQRFSVQNLLYF